MDPRSLLAHRRCLTLRLASGLLAAAILVPAAASAKTLVFIDPGHGGRYSNANHYGLKEKNVNLQLGLELKRQLLAEGLDVGMTRESDRALTYADIPTWHYSSSAGWRGWRTSSRSLRRRRSSAARLR